MNRKPIPRIPIPIGISTRRFKSIVNIAIIVHKMNERENALAAAFCLIRWLS